MFVAYNWEYANITELLLNHWTNLSPLHFGTQVPYNVEVEPPPPGLQMEFETLFSTEALQFLSDLCSGFQPEVDKVKKEKTKNKMHNVHSSSGFVLRILIS